MAHFTEFFTNLRHTQDQAHRDRQQFLQDTRAEVQEMARQLRSNLAEFATDLRNGGKAFRRGR